MKNMNNAFRLVLIGLACWLPFSCESDEVSTPLIFNGQIRNGDTNPSSPLTEIWIKIRYYGDGLSLLKVDSVMSNEFGSYSFEVPNSETLKQYSIAIQDEYFFQCNNFMSPAISDFIIPKDIDRTKANSDTLNACVTGKVRLVFSKLNVAAKDTLIVTPKVKTGSLTFIEYPTKVYADGELIEYFFSEKVLSVEYQFDLTKEGGETTTWVSVESIVAKKTKELLVSF